MKKFSKVAGFAAAALVAVGVLAGTAIPASATTGMQHMSRVSDTGWG